jgi:RHS repeat-associated protein
VSGGAQDREDTQVTVNGVVAGMSGTPHSNFSAVVPLNQGVNSLAIRATDHAGNHTDSTRTVTRDTQAPTLTVTSPVDNSYTNQNTVTVAGTVTDATTVTVKVNGVTFPVGQGGAFSGSYTLAAGANFLTITATDAVGNVTTQVRKVTQDRTPPALTITAPANGSYTNAIAVNVTGTASDSATVSVKVNGSPVTLNANGSFTYSLALTPGTNAISVVATDGAGNATTVSRTIIQDRDPPVTSMDEQGTFGLAGFTNADTVVIIETVTDASPVTVTLRVNLADSTAQSTPLTIGPNGTYVGAAHLAEGENVVWVDVVDAAGNLGMSFHSFIVRDTHPPLVDLTAPAEGANSQVDSILVSGVIHDPPYGKNAFSVMVNGVETCPDGNTFDSVPPPPPKCTFASYVHLVAGSNTISIVGRDGANNATTVTRTVTFGSDVVLPPDPATVAPPLDPTVATTTFAATSFLYTGPNPIQTGVAAGTIQPLQSALVHGTVRARTGEALPAVKVTVLDHPEFGQTLSRADGAFDLVVNGGEPLTLKYQKTGFLPAQRQVSALWQDYAVVDSVTLIGLDPQVTTVDFSQAAQAAQGGVVTDASGTRQATMIFKGGTHASLKMLDGSTQPVSSLAVRATEYTVGPTGPSAMPAPLPPTSAYTYAVELSADEAIAAGATSVLFDQPVSIYVDNFLNFPVGKLVPVGIYDRAKAQWVASPDGRIVKILQVVNGRASLDVDGSSSEASPEALAALGVNEAELTRLGALYTPGKSVSRVQLSHFTSADFNYPVWDTIKKPPTRPNPAKNRPKDKDCKRPGSVIGCERQTLGESIAIARTSLRLSYQSDGTPGYKEAYSTDISLIGDTVPPDLQRIELEVRVAGRLYTQAFSAQPNQSAHYVWDGNDLFGRAVQGAQIARIRIRYIYPAAPYADVMYLSLLGSFGSYAESKLSEDPARSEIGLSQDMVVMLGTHDTRAEGLGGWSIDVHHYYDPMSKVLHFGDGSRRTGPTLSNSATTIAGASCTANCANAARPGDPAVNAYLGTPGMVVAGDGSMYLNDDNANKIWRVNAGGILEHIGGDGTANFSGDGIPATSAGMVPNANIKIGPDNSVYFTDHSMSSGSSSGGRIRRIDKNGIITTVAGTGVCGTSFAEGTLATQANICFHTFAVAKDGTLFLEDRTEVYRVGSDGILTRIVGDGTYISCPSSTVSFVCAEGKPANAHAVFHQLNGIAVGADGTLYVANQEFRVLKGMVIYRIGVDGIIHRVAGNGNGSGPLINGLPATSSSIVSSYSDLAVGADGTLYYTEQDGWVYRVDEKGILRILAGCVSSPGPATCSPKSGGRATLTTLSGPRSVGFGPDGRLYIADGFARRIDPPLPALGINVSTIASEDGTELYVFDPDGKHLRTIDALLGSTIFEFSYDAAGHLSSISDGQGNITTVERDGTGLPVGIVGTFGQRTVLTTDGQHYLSGIQAPGQPVTVVVHRTDGLLSSLTDLNGKQHQFTYDDNGLLIRDDDGSGGFSTLARTMTDSSSSVTLTTAMGATVSNSTTTRSIGGSLRVSFDRAGLATNIVEEANGTVTSTAHDGTITTVAQGSDPRFGMQVPTMTRTTIRTPAGVLATITGGRRSVLSNPADPASLLSEVDSLILNGRKFRNTYLAATRTWTAVTPLGRTSTVRLDSLDRGVEEVAWGSSPLEYQYDSRGRLAQETRGSRQWSYAYDSSGRLASTTDALARRGQYFYDSSDRMNRQVLTDGHEVHYAYDAIGNLRSVTPPGRPMHGLQYDSRNLLTSYDPPTLGAGTWSTTFNYDLDGKLTRIGRPDGQTIGFGYDPAGRPSTVTLPTGTLQYTYNPITGNPSGASGPYGESVALSYDGSLLTSITWAGPVAGSVTASYNSDFQVTGLSVNARPAVGFAYDRDGLLNQAGDLSILRGATTGLIDGSVLNAVSTGATYTVLGELARLTAAQGGATLFDVGYTRDSLGRISELTESVAGTSTTKDYAYDLAGRVTQVRENGTLTAVYEYDANGNRNRVTRAAGVEVGAYDDQDRLLTYGSSTYTYTRGGELSTKTVASEVTNYEYDVLGNLNRVVLADGTVLEYIADAMNRRVGKKVNGVLVQGFLYQGQLNPVAELDGQGNIVSEFVYGTRQNVPDYMIKNGVTYRIIADHLGSVRLVVNVGDGTVAQRMDYDEFGKVLNNTSPGFQPFGFAGGLMDQQTLLVRYGARDYDPAVGRWTAKDPAGFGGGLGFYTYVANNPVNNIDPTGLCVTSTGQPRPCQVTWDPQASNHNVESRVMEYVQEIADAADVDLTLSSGRRAEGDDCSGSRHNCGLAVDINKINDVSVGGRRGKVNPNARDLIDRVQGIALGCPFVRENYGPDGLWKSQDFGGTPGFRGGAYQDGSYFADPGAIDLWAPHQNHIHLGFY